MKYKYGFIPKKKRAFTLLESMVYIFLTAIILAEGINIFVSMYKSYLETSKLTVKYNNYQNFFINLDNIIAEGDYEKVYVNNDSVTLSDESNEFDKIIKSNGGKILVKYTKANTTVTINFMLEDIDRLEVKKKGRLIYFDVYDKEGKEYIKCI